MPATSIDTARQLRKAIKGLSPTSPLTDHFSRKWRAMKNPSGGVLGVGAVMMTLPGNTRIDDAWKWVWVGFAAGGVVGVVVAALLRGRTSNRKP